jgi:hypothetical protein
MSQILEQEVTKSDEYYKKEVRRMLEKIRLNNEKMDRDQVEIDRLKEQSREILDRIEVKIRNIEKLLK